MIAMPVRFRFLESGLGLQRTTFHISTVCLPQKSVKIIFDLTLIMITMQQYHELDIMDLTLVSLSTENNMQIYILTVGYGELNQTRTR